LLDLDEVRKYYNVLTEIDNELGNLHNGDVLLPPDADASRALEVVPVHDNVNAQVEGNWDPRDSGVSNELSVAEESSGAMVVGVKEGWSTMLVYVVAQEIEESIRTERLLFEEQEAGIEQFQEFGEVVELNSC
jgi:hypothetical protein